MAFEQDRLQGNEGVRGRGWGGKMEWSETGGAWLDSHIQPQPLRNLLSLAHNHHHHHVQCRREILEFHDLLLHHPLLRSKMIGSLFSTLLTTGMVSAELLCRLTLACCWPTVRVVTEAPPEDEWAGALAICRILFLQS